MNGLLRAKNSAGPAGGQSAWTFEEFGRGLHGNDVGAIAIDPASTDGTMFCLCGAGSTDRTDNAARRFVYRYDPFKARWDWVRVPGYTWVGAFGSPAPAGLNDQGAVAYTPSLGQLEAVHLPVGPGRTVLIGAGPGAQAFQYANTAGRTGLIPLTPHEAPAIVVGIPSGNLGTPEVAWFGSAYQYIDGAPQNWTGSSGWGSLWIDPRVETPSDNCYRIYAYATICLTTSASPNALTPVHSHVVRARIELCASGADIQVSAIGYEPVAVIPAWGVAANDYASGEVRTYGGFATAVDLADASQGIFGSVNLDTTSTSLVVPRLEFGQVAGFRRSHGAYFGDQLVVMASLPRFSANQKHEDYLDVPWTIDATAKSQLGRHYALLRLVMGDAPNADGTLATATWVSSALNPPATSSAPSAELDVLRLPQNHLDSGASASPGCVSPPGNVQIERLDPDFSVARFFWMRASGLSGRFYAAGGFGSGNNSSAGRPLGLYRSTPMSPGAFATWSPVRYYRDWGASSTMRVAVRSQPIAFSAFSADLTQFRLRAVAAQRIPPTTPISALADLSSDSDLISGNPLVELVQRQRHETPCHLVAIAFHESTPPEVSQQAVAPGIVQVIASFTRDQAGMIPLVLNGESVRSVFVTTRGGRWMDWEFRSDTSGNSAAPSLSLISLKEFTGTKAPDASRWAVFGVPVLAMWLGLVRRLALANQAVPSDGLSSAPDVGYLQLRVQMSPRCFRGQFAVSARIMPWSNYVALVDGGQTSIAAEPWNWNPSSLLSFDPVVQSQDVDSVASKLLNSAPEFHAISIDTPLSTGNSLVRISFNFAQPALNPLTCPETCTDGSLQYLAAYGRTQWGQTWEYRRGADMMVNDLEVFPAASGSGLDDTLAFTDQKSSLFLSQDAGQSYVPIGSMAADGANLTYSTSLEIEKDAPRWVTQGYANMLSTAVVELPRLSDDAKPSSNGRRRLIALTDDGGVFTAGLASKLQQTLLPFADVNWNLPRYGMAPTPDGLGPPAGVNWPPNTYTSGCYRLAGDGTLEVLLAMPALGTGAGVVVVSRDGGRNWLGGTLQGLPNGEVLCLTSTLPAHSDLTGVPGPAGTIYAAVRGKGIFRLPRGSQQWRRTADFYGPRPGFPVEKVTDANAFAGALTSAPWQLNAPAPATGLGANSIVITSFRGVLLEESVLPALWSPSDMSDGAKPSFDVAAADALGVLAADEPAQPPTGMSQSQTTAWEQSARVVSELQSAMLDPYFVTIARDETGQTAVYAALRAPSSSSFLNRGVTRGPLPLGLAYPNATTQFDEFPAVLAAALTLDQWKDAVSAAMVYAGLYQLYDPGAGSPHPADAQWKDGLIWRQVAGLGLARAAVSQLGASGGIAGDALTLTQVKALNYPQGWRAVTSVSANAVGELAVTVENTAMAPGLFGTRSKVADATTAEGEPLGNAAEFGTVYSDGAVFRVTGALTATPQAELLMSHPKAAASAWEPGTSKPRLFVALNVYESVESNSTGASSGISASLVGGLTGAVPALLVITPDIAKNTVHAHGAFRASKTYFGPSGQYRWPVGLYWVTDNLSGVAPPTLQPNTTGMDTIKVVEDLDTFAASLVSPASIGVDQCFGASDSKAKGLIAIAGNWCCAPQRYFHLTPGRRHLYAGTRNGGAKRLAYVDI